MGIFDLFGKEPKSRETRRERFVSATAHEEQPTAQKTGPVGVFSPTSYEEVARIIDTLREGKNAIVHLEKLKQETVISILNMLSGAIYALGGGMYEMEKNIYMFSPTGVEVQR
jgi:cell division inhibitor SepF